MADIIINSDNLIKGIGKSSYFGMEQVRCCDIKTKPGIIRPNVTTAKNSASTVTDLISYFRKVGVNTYGVSRAPKLYKRVDGGGWSNVTQLTETGTVTGLEVWKGYILVFFNTEIVTIKEDTLAEDKAFESLTAGSHPSVIGGDDIVYIGNGNKLASLKEDTTFNPADSGTYTIDKTALDLPDGHLITSVVFLGSKIYIGTDQGLIYPWDTVSTSFDLPITVVKGQDINSMVVINNRIYIQSGDKMRIYISDGNSVAFFYELPETLLSGSVLSSSVGREGMAAIGEKLYIGFGGVAPSAIYSIDLKTKQVVIEHVISTGEDGTNNTVGIGAIIPTNTDVPSFMYSWIDEDSGGDLFGVDGDTETRYTGDKAFFITQFIQTGTNFIKRTFESIEGLLSQQMVANDSVKIYYRKSKSDSFTLVKIFDTTGLQSFFSGFGAVDTTEVQFKVFLNNTVEFRELRAK